MKKIFFLVLFCPMLLGACVSDVGDNFITVDEEYLQVVDSSENGEYEQYWEDRLNECEAYDDTKCSIATYLEKYESGDIDAGFKVIYYYRTLGDYESAYVMADRIGEEYPEQMGQAVYVKAEVAYNQEKNIEQAKEWYLLAADDYGDLLLAESPVGIYALKNLAGVVSYEDPEYSGELYRKILDEYSESLGEPLMYLQDAILFEIVGMNSSGYAYSGSCGGELCLFEDDEVTVANEVPKGFVELSESYSNYWFKLSEEDQAIYDQYE